MTGSWWTSSTNSNRRIWL